VADRKVVEAEHAADKMVAAPSEAAASVSGSAPFAAIIAMGSPVDVAGLIRVHRGQRDSIMFAVQQQRGNAFAQQVVSAVTAKPAHDADDKEEEEEDEDEPPSDDDVWDPRKLIDRFAGDPALQALANGERTYRKGDHGPVIRRLQQALFDLAYSPISVYGTFDDLMEARVKDL
jgi:hypothetical protein